MAQGGVRPGAGRPSEKIDMGLPPRKRGRPSKADLAARAALEAAYHAELQANGPPPAARDAPTPPVADTPRPLAGPTGKIVAYTPEMPPDVSPKDYLLALMRDPRVAPERRDKAAALAIAYVEPKPAADGKKGKKEQRQEAAEEVAKDGPFVPGAPPRLVSSNGH